MGKNRLKYCSFPDIVGKECDGCQKRKEGCHSSCEDYIKASLINDLLRMELSKEQDVKCSTQAYLTNKSFAKIKRKHPSTRYGKLGKRR